MPKMSVKGKNHFQKSFTIIELLVVIAVIGLISSIILVNLDLPGQKQKARIAKSLEFSQSLQNVLGSEAVGVWSFDDCGDEASVPTTLNDGSGYGNNGTNNGAICRDDTPHKVVGAGSGKYALSFNGAGDYVNLGAHAIYQFGTNPFTLEVWIKTSGAGTVILWHGTGTSGAYGITIGTAASFEASGAVGNFAIGTSNVMNGNWHHIVGVRDTSGTTDIARVYVDGVLEKTNTVEGIQTISPNGYFLELGVYHGAWNPSSYFNGPIDEVRIYSQALTIGQIQKHYAEGAEKFKLMAYDIE